MSNIWRRVKCLRAHVFHRVVGSSGTLFDTLLLFFDVQRMIAHDTILPKLSYSRLYYTPMKLCKTIAIQSPCSMSSPTRICKLEVLLCLSIFYFWQTHCPHSINRLLPVDCTVPGRDPPENFPKRGAPSESPSYIVT